MARNRKHEVSEARCQLGQGLVEFALMAPILLFTLMGIADFGRLFAVYSNLFNAAREGARYGVVYPKDVGGIILATRGHVTLVNPSDVDIDVQFDSGPGTPIKDFNRVRTGDRVIVTLNADVEMMTPFIRAIARQLHVETSATRTIATLHEEKSSTRPPAPATATPSPTPSDSPLDPPVPTATATMVPSKVPIQIDIPLWEGDTEVTGIAEPGEIVYLRDIQDPSLQLSTTVIPSGTLGLGTFEFTLPQTRTLVFGHVIAVSGYGSIDYAVVESRTIPAPTRTPTPTPTATPPPGEQYIVLDPTCGPEGDITINVTGHQWPVGFGNLFVYWDGAAVTEFSPRSDFSIDIPVTSVPGTHIVGVRTNEDGDIYYDTKPFVVPCPGLQPNLVVGQVSLENTGTISTYQALTFTVAVRNSGDAPVNSLFWVDLYADPSVEPPSPATLADEDSIAWAGIRSLREKEAITLTLEHSEGFGTPGEHHAYALVDTWETIPESDNGDNVSAALVFTLSTSGISPVPVPTPSGSGTIIGSTWLAVDGNVLPQARVDVFCYDDADGSLIAKTSSDANADYRLEKIPPGIYTVLGEITIDGRVYWGSEWPVEIPSGTIGLVQNVSLVLFETY